MEELFKKINALEDWYLKIPIDYRELDRLMKKADELGIYQSELCSHVGEAHNAWIQKKTEYYKKINQMHVVLKSKYKAEANSTRQLEEMNTTEGNYRYLKSRSEGVAFVLERMNQRISQLKEEWKLAKFIK